MTSEPLIYPMAAMVVLTFAVLVRLFLLRAKLAKAGAIDLSYFQTYQTGDEPVESAKLARHFSNIFEAPTLFYVACLAAMHLEIHENLLVFLAWVYVALRVCHAYVHTGHNRLRPRIGAYFGSWIVLLCMWGRIVVGA